MRSGASGLILLLWALIGCRSVVFTTKPAAGEERPAWVPHGTAISDQDSRWLGHTDYLDEVLSTIRGQWYKILEESRLSPPRGSHVVITFQLNARGEIDIKKVEDSGAGKLGVLSCQYAITYPRPYRKWNEAMIAALGDAQEISVTFYYK